MLSELSSGEFYVERPVMFYAHCYRQKTYHKIGYTRTRMYTTGSIHP